MTKTCAAEHCEEVFETIGAGKFCPLHAKAKKPKSPKKPKKAKPAEVEVDTETRYLVPLMVSENQLEDFWAKLPIEEKALAVQLYWDNQA